MKYLLFLLLSCLTSTLAGKTQATLINTNKLTSRQITTLEGLPSNTITCLMQDHSGFIWIGTNNGLCRYDGYNFAYYKNISTNPNLITDQHIGRLNKDSKYMYVQTANESKATYDFATSRFVAYQKAGLSKKKRKNKVLFKRTYQGYTYLYSSDKKLLVYDSKGKLIRKSTAYNQGAIKDTYYLSENTGELLIFPQKGNIKKLKLLPDAHYTTNRKQKFFIAQASKDEYYIATYGNGFFIYNSVTNSLTHYTAQDFHPIIQSNYLCALLIDSDNNIWIGTEEAGLFCITPSQENEVKYLYPSPNEQGNWSNYIEAVHLSSEKELYVGTRHDKVYRCNIETGQSTLVKEAKDIVMDILKDRNKHLWIATRNDGLYVDNKHYTSSRSPYYIPSDKIYALKEDARGRIWIATWENGLLLTDNNGPKHHFKTFLNKELNTSRLQGLELDANGILWIATFDGIYSIDTHLKDITEKSFKHYLPGNEVTTLKSVSKEKLYLGITGAGLIECKINKKGEVLEYENISKTLHLDTDNINSIEKDKYGYLWVGTGNGIFRLSVTFSDVRKYEFSNTFAGNTYSNNASGVNSNGLLVFGTRNGLAIIKPHPTTKKSPVHPCLITDMKVNGKSITANEDTAELNLKENNIELSHNQNSINIYFSRFHYASNYNIYQYYLEGMNEKWLEPTTQSHVEYSDLKPGKYIFHVRSIINGNPQQETTFTITITPPFYATWWAILLYIIAIGSVGYKFYRYHIEQFHIRQQIKLEKQITEFRLNFFTHVAHEFRTPLAIIQGGVNRLMEKKNTNISQADLTSTYRGTQRLLRLVNQFLNFRKINNHAIKLNVSKDDIIAFSKQLYQDFWDMAKQKEIQFTFTPFSNQYEVCFDHEKIETIIYNLLSNAIKYTPIKGIIEVNILKEKDNIIFAISNQGEEINAERKEHLFEAFMQGNTSQGGMGIGLYLAYHYAKEHKGKLSYYYAKEKHQNVFELSIPAHDDIYTSEDYQEETASPSINKEQKEQLNNIIKEMQGEAINNQHIAIIEDDPDIMEQLKLEIGGYFKTDCYMNGLQGYTGILTAPPALIICDVMLPDMDGYEIVKRLRIQQSLRNIPIIMLTALDDEEHQIKGYKCGADDYMTKPYNAKILLTRIIQLVKWAQTKKHLATTPDNNTIFNYPENEPEEKKKDVIMETKADKLFRESVQAIIAQNISMPGFTVDKIAEMMHMGRTTFYGKMKELTGISPNKYLQAERMRLAAQLLTDGRLNVNEVALKVGIQDPSYFYKCFKAKYGITPSKYAQTQMVEKQD